MMQKMIGFVGFGHMAQVLFAGFDAARLMPKSNYLFTRRDPAKKKQAEQKYKITATSLEHLITHSEVLILGVRPHQMQETLSQMLNVSDLSGKVIISMLAGIQIRAFEKMAPNIPIVRIMPNLASSVFEGVTTISFSQNCTQEIKEFSKNLFSAVGKTLEIDESLMDIACAIGGSGPGFVFKLIDAFAKQGQNQGLTQEIARNMAAQTFLGAAKLILDGNSIEDLVLQIAVPNGTTQAGFDKMRELKVEEHLQQVIQASAERSKELSL